MNPKSNVEFFFDEQGNKTDAVMTVKEFEKLIEQLQDLKDLVTVYERKIKKLKPIPLEEVRKELLGYDAKK